MGKKAGEKPQIPFAALPHGIAADVRLKLSARLTVAALLHWACDRPDCTVADRRLADYVGVSTATINRDLNALEGAGLIKRIKVTPTRQNMTGRIILLCWRKDPRLIPDAPPRDGETRRVRMPMSPNEKPAILGEGQSLVSDPHEGEGQSLVRDRVNHSRVTGAITGEGPGQSLVRDKEEVLKKGEESPPSSSSKKPDDDDEQASILDGEGIKDPRQLAIEAVRLCLGEDAAAIVEGDAEELATAVNGRWDLIEHAAYLAHGSPKAIGKPKGWLIKTALGFPPSGPSAEAKIAKKNALDPRSKDDGFAALLDDPKYIKVCEELEAEHAEAQGRPSNAGALIAAVEEAGFGLVIEGDLVRFTQDGVPLNRSPAFNTDFLSRLRSAKPEIVAFLQARADAPEGGIVAEPTA